MFSFSLCVRVISLIFNFSQTLILELDRHWSVLRNVDKSGKRSTKMGRSQMIKSHKPQFTMLWFYAWLFTIALVGCIMDSGSEIREQSSNPSWVCYIHWCENTFGKSLKPSPLTPTMG